MAEKSEFEASLGFQIRYPGLEDCNHNANGITPSRPISLPDIESQGDQKSIVVVLLGWFGADYKHLAKYSDIYLQKGCVVLECITPMRVLTYDKGKFPIVAHQVIVTLEEYHLEYNPIFFHVFSNAGSWVYSYIIKELAVLSKSKDLDIRGTIFDSAPFPLSAFIVYRTLVAHFSSKCFFGIGYPVSAAITSLWMLDTFWEYTKLSLRTFYYGEQYEKPDVTDKQQEPFPLYDWLPRVCRIRNHAFLFLYSENDDITPWEHLETIACAIETRGNSVMLVKFEGSKHVEHFRSFPVEYVEDIWSFLLDRMSTFEKPLTTWD